MYKMLVFVEPIHTTSDTLESNGASVMVPLATSNSCQVVDDSWVVQLYVEDEKSTTVCS